MIPLVSNVVEGQLSATSSNPSTQLMTSAVLAHGASNVRLMCVLRNPGASLTVVPRIRNLAVRKDKPGNFTAGSDITAAGVTVRNFDVSATTDQMFVQGALAAESSSGVSEGYAKVQIMVDTTARILARGALQVQANDDASNSVIQVIAGRPFPVLGLAGLMAGIEITGISGTLSSLGFAIRYFGDPTNPGGSWTTWTAWTSQSSNGLLNSGDETADIPSANSELWGQLAMIYKTTTGNANVGYVISGRF